VKHRPTTSMCRDIKARPSRIQVEARRIRQAEQSGIKSRSKSRRSPEIMWERNWPINRQPPSSPALSSRSTASCQLLSRNEALWPQRPFLCFPWSIELCCGRSPLFQSVSATRNIWCPMKLLTSFLQKHRLVRKHSALMPGHSITQVV
jgi:hypothetical protein